MSPQPNVTVNNIHDPYELKYYESSGQDLLAVIFAGLTALTFFIVIFFLVRIATRTSKIAADGRQFWKEPHKLTPSMGMHFVRVLSHEPMVLMAASSYSSDHRSNSNDSVRDTDD